MTDFRDPVTDLPMGMPPGGLKDVTPGPAQAPRLRRSPIQAMVLLAMIGGLAAEPPKDPPTAHECQCKHERHFSKKPYVPGNDINHKYGARYYGNVLVRTDYGAFISCVYCAKTCFAGAAIGPKV